MSTQRKVVLRTNNLFRIVGLAVAVCGLFAPIRQLDFYWWKPDSVSVFIAVGLIIFGGPTFLEILRAALNRGPKQ